MCYILSIILNTQNILQFLPVFLEVFHIGLYIMNCNNNFVNYIILQYAVVGVKGFTWGLTLPGFDLIRGMVIDYMHAVLLGVMKHLMTLWFSAKDQSKEYSCFKMLQQIKNRLMCIKPPNTISRVPRSLDDLQHWKGALSADYYDLDKVFFGDF